MKSEPPIGGPSSVVVTSTVRSGPTPQAVHGWVARLLAALPGKHRERGALSVLLCGDGRMRRLNREWRRQDRPTDVLSFPAGVAGALGDVVIDTAYAGRKARELGHPLSREVQILLAHGLLHLLGYDHETDGGEMFRLQGRLITAAFGHGPDGVPA